MYRLRIDLMGAAAVVTAIAAAAVDVDVILCVVQSKRVRRQTIAK